MSNQVIISIAREYASGGHHIANILAEKYNFPVYDSGLLDKIAEEKGIDLSEFQKYEEKRKNIFLSRTVAGHSNSPQDIVAQMEFDYLRERAAAGESFIVVGRCANSILSDFPNLISIFVTSDMEYKSERLKAHFPELTDREIERMIAVNNRRRKAFHNYYCKEKWGDSRYYELTVSTAKIGVKKAAEVVDKYITSRVSFE